MILHTALQILPVLSESDRKSRVEVIVQTPVHLIAILAILLDAKIADLVGVIPEPLGIEDDLVEILAFAIS